ncbi:type VII secretion integral membrane protein EccD [Mycobacterium sp. Dal123C01]|uniref:type VII secretion integral membrane protein EccD n=1 Tax=Mycobacterium sp. Dal123C01 TaxID=3457577 RepID=UPI00403EABDE
MSTASETDEFQVISAASQHVRLSLLSNRTQVDVTLPLDVPIANLTPELVKLARVGADSERDTADDPFANEANHNVWVLSRLDSPTPLPSSSTLRDSGVADGELLRLTGQRALTAPTLYDDVVDAAARLNKAGHAGWDATASRWMTFAGVHLASAVWVYFLLADALAPNRAAVVGLSVAVTLMLTGVAALAHRCHGQSDIGAALGWAVLPIMAAVGWVALQGLGSYGLATGCVVMVLLSATLFRAIGTGHWGYLALGLTFALTGLALVARAAGAPADLVGAGLASVATLGCLAVPRATLRLARALQPAAEPKSTDTVTPPGAEDIWARVRSETLTRSALYTGLAVSAGLGVLAVLTSAGPIRWPSLTFALSCAAALGLYVQRPNTKAERAGLAIPAAALTILSCALAQGGNQPMPLVAFGVLLTTALVFASIGTSASAGRLGARSRMALAYLAYMITAALIPLAMWVVGVYGRLSIA